MRYITALTGLSVLAALPAAGALEATLTTSLASPRTVATEITLSATAADTNPGSIDFRYRIRNPGQNYRTVQDFYRNRAIVWNPMEEGVYSIEATARNKSTGEKRTRTILYVIRSRVPDAATAVVTPTGHALVFVYSAPPCASGSTIRVRFRAGQEAGTVTPFKPCVTGSSRNFLLAGLRADLTYTAVHEITTGGVTVPSAALFFSTGSLPSTLTFPAIGWMRPPDAASCLQESIVLQSNAGFLPGQTSMPIATDLYGRVVWYYPQFASTDQIGQGVLRILPGGTFVLTPNDPGSALRWGQLLREIDLAGNTLRETNAERVSEQLVAAGLDPITSFHHDAILLPNGNLMALASMERVLTDTQGPGRTDVIGDMLIELDENLQVVWTWNSFDKLDTRRAATLGELCARGQAGCPPVLAADGVANDWLHSNSIHYSGADSNLLLSMRNQDWVVKIDYRNRQGTGNVLWRLGKGGDFAVTPAGDTSWFSHQHDAEFDIPQYPLLSLYDNGNVRRASNPSANSRGQVLWLDETAKKAQLVLNADLGKYSSALGSAERLCNGNYLFNSGLTTPTLAAESVEVLPSGIVNSILTSPNPVYRSFRTQSLYQP